MKPHLKKLSEQTLVITGASSGIGLATARLAARRGARVVLASRNEAALQRVTDEIQKTGGQACYVVADVADTDAVMNIANVAIDRFGGFDTWVNNAGVSVYGKLTEVAMKEKRRLFDVNFWGVVNGCRAAYPHLREKGGAIINLGSVLSEWTMPLQGMYSASKHAVKAYTDALRMELEESGVPMAITLVKPAAINTPYVAHAANHLEFEPILPAPVYAPETVARAIVYCAEHAVREVNVGGGGRAMSWFQKNFPRAGENYLRNSMVRSQQTQTPVEGDRDRSLFTPSDEEGRASGSYPGHVMKSSVYTEIIMHPMVGILLRAGLGILAIEAVRAWNRKTVAAPGGTTDYGESRFRLSAVLRDSPAIF